MKEKLKNRLKKVEEKVEEEVNPKTEKIKVIIDVPTPDHPAGQELEIEIPCKKSKL